MKKVFIPCEDYSYWSKTKFLVGEYNHAFSSIHKAKRFVGEDESRDFLVIIELNLDHPINPNFVHFRDEDDNWHRCRSSERFWN